MVDFQPLYYDESTLGLEDSMNSVTRHRFLNSIALSVDLHIVQYEPSDGLGYLIFFWKVRKHMAPNEAFRMDNKVLHELRHTLPEYHTRKMRKEFYSMYEHVSSESIPPHVLTSIDTTLTC